MEDSEKSYTYSELSESAKQRARDGMSDNQTDFNWWEHTYEDAVLALVTIGIEVGQKANRLTSGKIIHDPSIWFSGFSSQGDGCSFEGVLRIADMKECEAKAKEYAPQDEIFHGLAAEANSIFESILTEQIRQRLLGLEDYPDCITGATFLISSASQGFSTKLNSDSDLPQEIEADIDSWLERVASWIYDLLEQEYDYLTSDESLAAACEGYTFDEDGKIA